MSDQDAADEEYADALHEDLLALEADRREMAYLANPSTVTDPNRLAAAWQDETPTVATCTCQCTCPH